MVMDAIKQAEANFVNKSRGHRWATDEDGEVDWFAYEAGSYHNGPRCVACGRGWCEHCDPAGPDEDCDVLIEGEFVTTSPRLLLASQTLRELEGDSQ